jgi:hypothetical protein
MLRLAPQGVAPLAAAAAQGRATHDAIEVESGPARIAGLIAPLDELTALSPPGRTPRG